MARTELTVDSAPGLLERMGIVRAEDIVSLEPLGGGVSSVVLRAETKLGGFIIKQPRERFAVPSEWRVDAARVHVEAAVGRWLHAHLGPGSARVARVRGHSVANELLVVEAAPSGWTTWKEHLLSGWHDLATAETAGRLLRRIHCLSSSLPVDRFRHDRLFQQQRIEPYWRTAAMREPRMATHLAKLETMFFARNDLVHGDYSPKNILVGPNPRAMWLVDHEVVTRGDAAFDVGFMWTHLALKAIHNPANRKHLAQAGSAFAHGYGLGLAGHDEGREARALRFMGGLLLARAVGKSPAEYLNEPARLHARELAIRLLNEPPASWQALQFA